MVFTTRVGLPPARPWTGKARTFSRLSRAQAKGGMPASSRGPPAQAMREEGRCTTVLEVEPLDEQQVRERRLAPCLCCVHTGMRCVGARPPRLGLD